MSLTGTVSLIELTGPEKIVTLNLGEKEIIASLPAEENIAHGQSLTLYVDAARISVFDNKTGLRL